MTKLKLLFLASLSIFIFSLNTNAQNKRPKIGLVLSGGGAKGMAHIGVLKAMEEAGLTPDYVTGTSMGSIIGGLYSIGWTPDELEQLVENADWDQILTNKVPLDKVTFEEKEFYGRYPLEVYVEDKQLILPAGVIDGQALMVLFSEVTRSVHNITDFNKFPIPYACVATNIVTGEPVVLNHGSLAVAMRASMAIPTVFTPVKIDGQLLVDGGLVRNMPVQEVLDMGADIVIGVFVGTSLNEEKDLKSLVSILAQSAFITSARDAEIQFQNCDILIRPDLTGYTTASFHDADSIVERGIEAGQKYLETFRHLADSLKQLGPLHQIKRNTVPDSYVFDRIEVEGNDVVSKDFIIGRLGFDPGEAVTPEFLDKRIEFIYGTQYFQKIYYEILGEPDNQTLKIFVSERPATDLRLSYHYDTDNNGGIIGNATFRNAILNSSRLILETDLSSQPSVIVDYFKYMGKKQMFALGTHALFNSNDLPIYANGEKSLIFRTNYFEGGIKAQSTTVQNSTFGIELNLASMSMKDQLRLTDASGNADSTQITKVSYSGTRYRIFYEFNNRNERYFPTRGIHALLQFSSTLKTKGSVYVNDQKLPDVLMNYILRTSNIYSLKAEIAPIFQLSPKWSLLSKARLSLSTVEDSQLNLTEFDFIGGFTPDLVNSLEFYGAKSRQYALANYFYGRAGAQYEIKRNIYLQAQVNYLSSEFLVKTLYPDASTGTINNRSYTIGYGLMLGMESPIGPIVLMAAKDHYLGGLRLGLKIGFY